MRLFKRKNGYWYYEFEHNKPRSLKTKDKALAVSVYSRLKKEYLKGKLINLDTGRRITIKQFEKIFFTEHADIANPTVVAYELAFKLLSQTFGGSTLLSRIAVKAKINEFKKVCLARGVKKVSINTYLRHIRSILNKACAWGFLKEKPQIELYKLPKRHPRILTPSERDSLLKHSHKTDYQIYRVIKFCLYSGARRAEVASLTWPMVGSTSCRLIGKGDRERTIPLLDGAIEAIGARKDIGYVFEHFKDLSVYTKRFKEIARTCGIEDLHLHNLRHTAATEFLRAGMSLEAVREILGHVDLSTTEIYAKMLQERINAEAKKYECNLYKTQGNC
jgi:integrase